MLSLTLNKSVIPSLSASECSDWSRHVTWFFVVYWSRVRYSDKYIYRFALLISRLFLNKLSQIFTHLANSDGINAKQISMALLRRQNLHSIAARSREILASQKRPSRLFCYNMELLSVKYEIDRATGLGGVRERTDIQTHTHTSHRDASIAKQSRWPLLRRQNLTRSRSDRVKILASKKSNRD